MLKSLMAAPGISHEIVRRATGRNSGSTSAGATRLNRDPGRMAEHYFRTESIALAHLGAKSIGCGSKDFAWIPLMRRRSPTEKPLPGVPVSNTLLRIRPPRNGEQQRCRI